MVKKIVNLVVLVPLGIVLVVLSVANRQSVTLALNPFRPEDAVLSLTAPFFVFLFLAVMFGIVIGGVVVWFSQRKYRKRARTESRSAQQWQVEAERHKARAEQIAGRDLPQLQSK